MINIKDFDEVKRKITSNLFHSMEGTGEDVGYTKDGQFNCPVVNEEGKEAWAVITVSIPKGSRDGDDYDGYDDRDAYKATLKKRAQKAEEKAKKIARDSEKRSKPKEEKTE